MESSERPLTSPPAPTGGQPHERSIGDVVRQMEGLLARLDAAGDARRHFLGVYLRMTRAVAEEIATGSFLDPAWVERWDVVFADLYLEAAEAWDRGGKPPEPWRVAFGASNGLPVLRHVLLGINAHINYDLPLSLLAVISDDEFADRALVARRAGDHHRIDTVLAYRVPAEDQAITAAQGGKNLYERIKTPLERMATARFLREAREKVWANALLMAGARRRGDTAEVERLRAELERRAAAKLEQLATAREVLLQLWLKGFGVRLSGAGR